MAGFRPAEAKTGGFFKDMSNSSIGEEVAKGMGRMFYIASPSETSFPDLKSLPKNGYIQQAAPYFFLMILLEWVVLWLQGRPARAADGLISITHGLLMTLGEMVWGGVTFSAYLYIYSNYSLYDLPWDSTLTWIIAAVGIDFCY